MLRYKNLLPIVLLLCLCVYTGFMVFFHTVVGTINNILAFAFVLAGFFTYFYARKQFKYLVFATLCLGLVGVLNFTPFTSTLNIAGVSFHIVPFLFILLYFLLNYRRIIAATDKDIDIPDPEKLEHLKVRYQTKTVAELEDIIGSSRYGKDAKTAAAETLVARKADNEE